MVGAMSSTVSATKNDTNTITSSSEFPEAPAEKDIYLNVADDLKPEFVPGEVLIKFRTGISTGSTNGIVTTGMASVDKLNKRFETHGIERVFSNVYKLKLPKDASVLSVAREYETDPNVEYAEPNVIYQYFIVPNDANYTQQWAHQMIESEYAWNATTGDPSVVIAIVDSGVDWDHPDLAANIWINTDEIPDNGVDDDENGYIDDVRGWDFAYNDSDPMDEYGHGTHCSGIVAAVGNNNEGIAGASWNSKIMALRVGSYGVSLSAAASAIHYATDNGADIISMSWGGSTRSAVVYDAIKYAHDHNVLLVAAAGNVRSPLKPYPAGFEEVIAVAATDQDDNPADWPDEHGVDYGSAFGEWIELAAPGDEIYSTVPWGYDYASGTSMATPHVAGVAALIWSQFPDMTRDQVQYQLRRTAVDKGDPGFDIYYGYGRINASGAVNQDIPNHDLLAYSWKLPFASEPTDTAIVNTTVLNFGESTKRNINVKLLVNGIEMDVKEITMLKSGESETVSCLWIPTAEGKYNVTTYVEPKKHEDDKENNAQSAYTYVRYGKAVRVPTDFTTIKEAVNTTNLEIYHGDATIWVASGTYYEYDLLIQNSWMSLTLTGENRSTSIIDSAGQGEASVWVHTDNVAITELTIQNISDAGILLLDANNSTIRDNTIIEGHIYAKNGIYISSTSGNSIIGNNTITKNSAYYGAKYGIFLSSSSGHLISNNNVLYSADIGIYLFGDCYDNTISGNTISNNGYMGIYILDSDNNTISGNTISNTWDSGLKLIFGSAGNLISGNIITDSDYKGLNLFSGQNNVIVENTIQNNGQGIYSYAASNNVIHHNNFINNDEQIYFIDAPNNTWDDGEGEGNYWSDYNGTDNDKDGIGDTYLPWQGVDWHPLIHPWGSIRNIDTGLTYVTIQKAINAPETSDGDAIEVKAGTYYENVVVDKSLTLIGEGPSTTIIDGSGMGDVVTVQANNVHIGQLMIQNGQYGIRVDSNNTVVSSNTVSNNGYYGIFLENCKNTSVIDNTVTNSDSVAVYLIYCNNVSVSGNTVANNTGSGIFVYRSINAIVSSNMVSNNKDFISGIGITINNNMPGLGVGNSTVVGNMVVDNYDGIRVHTSRDNVIRSNTVLNNSNYGIYLHSSRYNNITENWVSNNKWGILLSSSMNNTVYHNNIIDNIYQAHASESPFLLNKWDDGYPSGGNYWSDYTGQDVNGDGIGDTPYVINQYSKDDYPLMIPWGFRYEHELYVAVEAPAYLKLGNSSLLNATVHNKGLNNETNVELFLLINGTVVNNVTIPELVNGTSYTISYLWTPTVEAKYNVTAHAPPVLGEDIPTNNLVTKIVKVAPMRVHNIDSGLNYSTIQEAIDASETLDGHTIEVEADTYYENVVVDKSLTLMGEDSSNTIIDGSGDGYVVTVQANNVNINQFTIRNGLYGVELDGVQNCTVSNNIVSNNSYIGVHLLYSSYNLVSGNTISDKHYLGGVYVAGTYNSISGNIISNNDKGVHISSYDSNLVSGNTISNNEYGVYLITTDDNAIYHNNFIDNTVQGYVQPWYPAVDNAWDDGYPSGGNYWNDYTGDDEFSGPYQNQPGSDGIGDTPYTITGLEGNQDNYPLMDPWNP